MGKYHGWIGVDLDGTLAKRIPDRDSLQEIGAPIPAMVARVCSWLDEGREVRIFTARASHGDPLVDKAIRAWCLRHIGCELLVTCSKDRHMDELWDDRAVGVEQDTGRVPSEDAARLTAVLTAVLDWVNQTRPMCGESCAACMPPSLYGAISDVLAGRD